MGFAWARSQCGRHELQLNAGDKFDAVVSALDLELMNVPALDLDLGLLMVPALDLELGLMVPALDLDIISCCFYRFEKSYTSLTSNIWVALQK